jgi:DMSO/TMAO reductase YedYZ heme-binding membrane subunit
MSPLAASTGPTALWYVARGSGLAALVVLTLSVVLGIVTSVRWTTTGWPRFVIELLHRNTSLLATALIGVHLTAVVVDAFAPIGWKDTVIPFVSAYRPVWLGLGAVAFDLLLALMVTSLLRHRIRHQTWRLVHWFAYLCWPLVVVHGLGTGSDTKVGFVLALYVGCIVAVIAAAWWRLATGWPDHARVRIAGLGVSLLAPVLLVVWLADGPLAAGWARRAGTPPSILARAASSSTGAATPPPSAAPASGAALPALPFSAQLDGSIDQSSPDRNGDVTVHIAGSLDGGQSGRLDLALTGPPVEGGGILLDTSQVTLGPGQQPDQYRGTVVNLRGDRIVASLQSGGRPSLDVTMTLTPDLARGVVRGSVQAQTASASGGRE